MKDVKRKQDRARKGGEREGARERERKEGGKKGMVGKGVAEEDGREGRREKKRKSTPTHTVSDIEQLDPNYQQDRTPWTQGFALK